MAVIAPAALRPRSWGWVQALRALPEPARVGVAAALGLLLGGLTSPAQTVLPDAVESIANSSGGWALAVVLVVALVKPRTGWAAVEGPFCFTGLTLGYQIVSTLRGYPTSEVFFLVAGLVVGPFIGVAAAWLRARGWRAALAAALLAGIGIGEGVFGLTVVAGSTSPVYWSLELVGAVVLLAVVVIRRTGRWWERLVAVAGALAVAGAFLAAYGGAGFIS